MLCLFCSQKKYGGSERGVTEKKKRIAVCPGSFDPVTLGHADIIRRAAKIFGSAEVVVMNNMDKTYCFSIEERCHLCKLAFEGEENIKVTFFEGWLYEYLQGRVEETVLVKGVRSAEDLEYERIQTVFNKEKCGVETLYLDADPKFQKLSSTQIRALLSNGGDISPYLPKSVVKFLSNKM